MKILLRWHTTTTCQTHVGWKNTIGRRPRLRGNKRDTIVNVNKLHPPRISLRNSADNLTQWWLLRKERKVSRMRVRNKRPGRTHLETKASLPIWDCSSVLVADFLVSHLGNKSVCNSKSLSGVTDIVKFIVSKRTPRQVTRVDGRFYVRIIKLCSSIWTLK